MKKYKVVVSEDNEDLRDLVNISDSNDRIPLAPDNFKDGEIVTEDQFYLDECNYVDEQGTGTMEFAFEKIEGFKIYRHKGNPIEKELHDKFIEEYVDENPHNSNILEKIIFGCSNDAQTIPNDYLSDREKRIVISTIQWLGSPVGQGFLRSCGFRHENDG